MVAALTGAVVFQGMKRFYASDTYKSELARARVNLEALRQLEEGHVQQAVQLLEQDLQSSALVLDVDASGISNDTYRKIREMREQIRDYQTRKN